MLTKLAWRNIWRNKRRSIIVLSSIVVGTIAMIFLDSFTTGALNQWMDSQLSLNISFVQIYKKGFSDDKVIQNYLPEKEFIEKKLYSESLIKNFSERISFLGLLNSAYNSSGVNFIGVNSNKEPEISKIHKYIITGNYLSGKKNEIMIGKKLADKLEVYLGDKIVLMASDIDGKVSSDLFRVTGIFQSSNSEFDKYNVYINIATSQELLGIRGKITEIAINLENRNLADSLKNKLTIALGDQYEIKTYKDLLPMLTMFMEMSKSVMGIFFVIIGVAMIFGIINTKMMSVFERIREFGILMANGMRNTQIFQMIIIEAFFIGITGLFFGLLFGIGLILPLSHYGINMSSFADTLSKIGFSAIIYPVLSSDTIINSSITILLTTILGSLYPAIKTIRLEPVAALRYV
jgi:putative ABC transport system permease protein